MEQQMAVSEIDAVVSEVRIAARPDIVFSYLIDPDRMQRWMGSRVEADPRPGGVYAVDINDQACARGEFVEVVPNARVVFTFGWTENPRVPPGSTTVEVTLEADGDGTRVRLVHRGLSNPQERDDHRHGWTHYLARLAVAGSGGSPGPDPNANPAPAADGTRERVS
jgi:uncharacterized protein YndB with AHSA1/START domain